MNGEEAFIIKQVSSANSLGWHLTELFRLLM